jgi:hypothetical protein
MYKYFLQILLSLLLGLCASAQPPSAPTKITLPDTVACTATGRTVAGKSWAYVVLQPSDPASIKNKAFRVYGKSAAISAPGTFLPLGEIRPVTDKTTIGVLVARAVTLGEDSDELTSLVNTLIDQWKIGNQRLTFDISARIGMLVNRAQQSEKDAATLRQLAVHSPAIRMAMGLAWGGPVNLPPGNVYTFEVREISNTGTDVAVVGRSEWITGQATTLAAPSAPVQVPDLSAEGDLIVKLRWGLSTNLRRQALQTTGFRVWRVSSGASLPSTPTLAQVLAAPGAKQVTDSPILITKLFSFGNASISTDVANFTTDSSTSFVADDNGRDQSSAIVPKPETPPFVQKTGVPHVANTSYKYYIAALDWLGQPGTLSTVGTGIAIRTLPPPVPGGVKVEEVNLGGASSQVRLRVSFDANQNSAPNVTSTRYAIYRGGSDAQSLEKRSYLLPDPELPLPPGETGLNAMITPSHQSGRISYTDTALNPSGNLSSTFWYSVRAINDTPLGAIYSAPSPPIFGTFHDYSGPSAPYGNIEADCLHALCREDSVQFITSDPLSPGETVLGKGRMLRLKAKRLSDDITRVQFLVIDPRTSNSGTGPQIVFAPGETEVFFDTIWLDPSFANSPSNLIVAAACLSASGSVSYIGWRQLSWGGSIVSSNTNRTVIGFECAVSAASSLNSSSPLTAKMLINPGSYTLETEGQTIRAILNTSAYNERSAVVTITRSGQANRSYPAIVSNNIILFADPGQVAGAPSASYSIRIVREYQNYAPGNETSNDLPPAWPAGSNWPPKPTNCPHATSNTANGATAVTLTVNLTTDTKEYRIFRQVDGGELAMFAEGVVDASTSTFDAIVVADQPNLPVSGRVCYFAQLVDKNGNTSPLTQIGCVDILAPTPIPVLNEPKVLGSTAAPLMGLEWFCPADGVKRFRIRIVDLTNGDEIVSSPNASEMPADAVNPVYFNYAPGTSTPTSLPQGTSFATNISLPLNGAGTPPPSNHTAQFSVQLDHEYQVEVMAEGIIPSDITRSLPRKFTWHAPVASGSVAWPARPMPRVIDGAPYNMVARELRANNAYFANAYAAPINHFSDEITPVLIPLGLMPVTSNGYTTSRQGPEPTIQAGSWPLLTVNTSSFLYRGSANPNDYFFTIFSAASASKAVTVPPVVLYRQIVNAQSRDTTNTADMVQASPLVSSITWRTESGKTAIVDPLIVTLPSYDTATSSYTAASFWLPDTKPVTIGYTYRYFLVRFGTDFEIEQVIDCGSVTISQ